VSEPSLPVSEMELWRLLSAAYVDGQKTLEYLNDIERWYLDDRHWEALEATLSKIGKVLGRVSPPG
jgi:hypothetical protein